MGETLVYTKKETAEQLRVDIRLLDRLLSRAHKPIPHFRHGRKILIPAAKLNEWANEEGSTVPMSKSHEAD